jgi:hypothetical protein
MTNLMIVPTYKKKDTAFDTTEPKTFLHVFFRGAPILVSVATNFGSRAVDPGASYVGDDGAIFSFAAHG